MRLANSVSRFESRCYLRKSEIGVTLRLPGLSSVISEEATDPNATGLSFIVLPRNVTPKCLVSVEEPDAA